MMQNYKAQSLAIILVLLVLGSMLGFALYARFARESSRVVDEKASSEANELTETVVGLISTSTYEKVTSEPVLGFFTEGGQECSEESLVDVGCRRSEISLSGLGDFFDRMSLEVDFSDFNFLEDLGEDYCLSELAMRYSFEDDEITIQQDDIYSVFVNKVDWNNCESIDFFMTDNGESEGFVLSTFYGKHDPEKNLLSYKEYVFEDINGYHYEGKNFTGSDASIVNWTSYNSGIEPITFNRIKAERFFGQNNLLNEIRFKSLGGSSNLRWSLSGGGCEVEGYLLMEVSATCGGQYAGKTFVLPGEVFAPPIFDYVLFNGTGKLIPEAIQLENN